MTPELIIQLATALLGTGGIIALFLITEKKAAAQLANTERVNEQWQKIVAQKEKDYLELNQKYEVATAKIDKLYEVNFDLRTQLDVSNTDCAVSKIMRCDCVACSNRQPPFKSLDDLKPIIYGK